MNMVSKENNSEKKVLKKITPRSLMNTIKYSLDGLIYFYRSEKSAIIHLACVILAIIIGLVLKITVIEAIIIAVLLTMIISVELLNSGLEAICDLVSLEYQPLIKVAKDCGSAATFILSTATLIIGIIIYIPYIIDLVTK